MAIMKFFSLIAFQCIVISVISQTDMSGSLDISMPKKNVSKFNDFTLKVIISNFDLSKKLVLRKCINFEFGYKKQYFDGTDIVVELEKLNNQNKYKQAILQEEGHHGGICYDSLGNEAFDTLITKTKKIATTNLVPYYVFTKGKYRVRVKFLYNSKSHAIRKNIIYSRWMYFNFISNEVDYSDFGK
jgi:hypothetical protein